MLTCPSPMASSSAAWVLGGVRLISSASSSWVNTGPGRNCISAVRWSYMGEPDPREVQAEDLREGPGDQRLAQAGEVLQENVAAGQDPDQHQFQRPPVPDDRALHLGEHLGGPLRG